MNLGLPMAEMSNRVHGFTVSHKVGGGVDVINAS
jgi:hypothetical protein